MGRHNQANINALKYMYLDKYVHQVLAFSPRLRRYLNSHIRMRNVRYS